MPSVRVLLAGLAGALLLALPAAAQTFPRFSGLVVDAANVLPPEQETALTRRLDDLQRTTGNQLVVATVPDLEGYDIDDYGNRLLRAWGLGLKGADNGALLIVAPNERKVRVEVGYRLEPVLTDAFSSVVIRRQILPRFKSGDMPGGIVAGATAIADQLALPDAEAKARVAAVAAERDRTRRRGDRGGGGVPIGLIFWGIVLAAIVVPMLSRRIGGRRYRGGGDGSNLPIVLWSIANEMSRSGRGGGWSGGSSGGGSSGGGWMGGGFTGGGGGSSGGGGASGSW